RSWIERCTNGEHGRSSHGRPRRRNSAAPAPEPEKIKLRPTRREPLASPSGKRDDRDASSRRAVSIAVQASTTTRAAMKRRAPFSSRYTTPRTRPSRETVTSIAIERARTSQRPVAIARGRSEKLVDAFALAGQPNEPHTLQ